MYHFRARYYDPETGRFISRDPVDIIETEPESSHPYQFVYNNPHMYSDPSGAITILELNARSHLENVINGIKAHTKQEIKDQLIEEGKKIAADAAFSTLETFLPINFGNRRLSGPQTRVIQAIQAWQNNEENTLAGFIFEVMLKTAFCQFLDGRLHTHFWLEPDVWPSNGSLDHIGYTCPEIFSTRHSRSGTARPDFLVVAGSSANNPSGEDPFSYLVGDIKLSVVTIVNQYFISSREESRRQWEAMTKHAKNYGLRFLAFPTLYAGRSSDRAALRQRIVREATEEGVVVFLASAQ